MKTLTLQIPDGLDVQEAKSMLASKLYEKGSLTLGQAAELAGYSKRIFMDLLANYGVSLFNYSETEIDKDIQNAKNYHI